MNRLLAIAAVLAWTAFTLHAAGQDDLRPAPANPCMDQGMMGPGTMGGGMMELGKMGPEMMGVGMMAPWMADGEMPQETRDKLRALQESRQSAMQAVMREWREGKAEMNRLMVAFPLDSAAVRAQSSELNRLRQKMLELHLAIMNQAQRLLGEERWRKMHESWGKAGTMAPGRMDRRGAGGAGGMEDR